MDEKNPLSQIVELINKTGDRCIIVDDGKAPYVVMSLKEYERLIGERDRSERRECQEKREGGLTGKDLLDKISQEIVAWKARAGQEGLGNESNDAGEEAFLSLDRPESRGAESRENRYYIEPAD